MGTIEGHLARGITSGALKIENLMDQAEIVELEAIFKKNPDSGLSEIYQKTDGKYSYGKLRMVANAVKQKETKTPGQAHEA